ncbi:PilZ domain-containing protein [Modestobacter marinus]|uniref:PilZ domain-containing protein n=1 Tax=Modestobacter marinus TaxID=477641 RepID=UPI001C95DA3A|nr:PilZ domain-containing protein [Modestobacter marinus]
MALRKPNVDHPGQDTALSILPLGKDEALTSRVRRYANGFVYVTQPRNGIGTGSIFVDRDLLEVSWQSDDGLRSVPTEIAGITSDGLWKLRIAGPASRVQRRESVRAPIGLRISVSWDATTLVGSTVDLSEGGLLAVFRPNGDLGLHVPYPSKTTPLELTLDLYSDELVTDVLLVRRRRRSDSLHEWSLRFVALPPGSADLIRSHVFTALRNARARGLAAIY